MRRTHLSNLSAARIFTHILGRESLTPDDQIMVNRSKNSGGALEKKAHLQQQLPLFWEIKRKGILTPENKKSGNPLTSYGWEDLVKNENIFGKGTAGEYGAAMLWKVSIFPFLPPLLFCGKGMLCKVCPFLFSDLFRHFFSYLICQCR